VDGPGMLGAGTEQGRQQRGMVFAQRDAGWGAAGLGCRPA
jgi:hypothetical protein